MSDNTSHDTDDESNGSTTDPEVKADGGVASGSPAQAHRNTDYLSSEVNLLNPSTQFMRDHLRLVWTGFAIWFVVVFGPVTLTRLAPDLMTTQMPVLGFPLHYFLVAIGGPTGALLLSFWYARKRDALDAKYGIDHATVEETGRGGEGATATDGGERSGSDRDPRRDADRTGGGERSDGSRFSSERSANGGVDE